MFIGEVLLDLIGVSAAEDLLRTLSCKGGRQRNAEEKAGGEREPQGLPHESLALKRVPVHEKPFAGIMPGF